MVEFGIPGTDKTLTTDTDEVDVGYTGGTSFSTGDADYEVTTDTDEVDYGYAGGTSVAVGDEEVDVTEPEDARRVSESAQQRLEEQSVAGTDLEVGDMEDWTSTEGTLGFDVTDRQDLQENVDLISEDWSTTEDFGDGVVANTAQSYAEMGQEIREGDFAGAANKAGETTLNIATRGDAEEFREDFIEDRGRENYEEWQQRVEEGYAEDGFWSDASATNEVLKTGYDAMADAPRGFNLQETTQSGLSYAGVEDEEHLADISSDAYETWADVKSKPAEVLPDYVPGSEGTTTATVVGTGFEWFVEDPVKAGYTFATGVDPETGETDARAEPIDLIDVFSVGAGSALKTGAKTARAGSGLLNSGSVDEVTEAARNTAQRLDPRSGNGGSPSSSGRSGTPSPQTAGFTGGIIGETMVKGIDELGRILRRGTRGASGSPSPSTASPPRGSSGYSGVNNVDTSGLDDLGSAQRTVGTGPNAGSPEAPPGGMPDGAPAGATPADGSTNIDDVTQGVTNNELVPAGADAQSFEAQSLDTPSGSGTPDGASGTSPSDDPLDLGGISPPGSGAVAGGFRTAVGATTSTASSVASRFSDAFSGLSGADESGGFFGRFTRSADEPGASAGDEASPVGFPDDATTGAGDDGLSGFGGSSADPNSPSSPDGSSPDGDADPFGFEGTTSPDPNSPSSPDGSSPGSPDGSSPGSPDGSSPGSPDPNSPSSPDGSWWSRQGGLTKAAVAGTGTIFAGSVLEDLTGWDVVPFVGGDSDGPDVPSNPFVEQVKVYNATGAALLEVFEMDDPESTTTIGYAVWIPMDLNRLFAEGQASGQQVLNQNGRPTPIDPLYEDPQGGPVPQGRFGSESQADDAHQAFVDWLDIDDSGDETRDPPEGGATGIRGDLTVPERVSQGADFEGAWLVELTDGEEYSSRLEVGISNGEEYLTLGEDDVSITADQPAQEGTFQVSGGWQVTPGEWEAMLVVYEDDEPAVIEGTATPIEIVDGGGNDEAGPNGWGDPEMVRELPYGWYLYAQPNLETGETRFLVAGTREDGTTIYLHDDGRARPEAYPFATVEETAAALEKWVSRVESGQAGSEEMPSENAGRPQSEQVKKDAAEADQGLGGIVDRLSTLAQTRPLVFVGASATTLAAAYYLYTEGYFDSAIRTIKNPLS